ANLSASVRQARPGGFVAGTDLTLDVTAHGAARISVAEDAAFTIARLDRDATEIETGASAGCEGCRSYALADSLCAAACDDGPYALFVKIADAEGYESDPLRLDLILDRKDPDLLAGSVAIDLQPPLGSPVTLVSSAGVGATVRVTFIADELVRTPT